MNSIEELIKQIHSLNPELIKNIEEKGKDELRKDKMVLYDTFFKTFSKWDSIKLVLDKHSCHRLDVAFTKDNLRYKVSFAYRPLPTEPPEEIKENGNGKD
jgi:UDP-galactopyranose mutase